MSDAAEATKTAAAERPGPKTTELWVTVAQLVFAGWALYLGKDDVAMVALAAAGAYPISRAITKR